MMNEYNPKGLDIRFIDSHYKDLFRIPDGGYVKLTYSDDETVTKRCKFIDEYHTQVGFNAFHICQFAEVMERNGTAYQPEPEITAEQAAWKVGKDRFLAIQTCEDGYDYTLFDDKLIEIDGGQLDNPDMSMKEIRTEILEDFKLDKRDLVETDYDELMERAVELEIQNVREQTQTVDTNMDKSVDPFEELANRLDRFAESLDPYEYKNQVLDVEAHVEDIRQDLAGGNFAPYLEYLDIAIEESGDKSMVDAARALKKELEQAEPKKVSVIDQLSQKVEKAAATKGTHKPKDPER